jgi:hypothetical protein
MYRLRDIPQRLSGPVEPVPLNDARHDERHKDRIHHPLTFILGRPTLVLAEKLIHR